MVSRPLSLELTDPPSLQLRRAKDLRDLIRFAERPNLINQLSRFAGDRYSVPGALSKHVIASISLLKVRRSLNEERFAAGGRSVLSDFSSQEIRQMVSLRGLCELCERQALQMTAGEAVRIPCHFEFLALHSGAVQD